MRWSKLCSFCIYLLVKVLSAFDFYIGLSYIVREAIKINSQGTLTRKACTYRTKPGATSYLHTSFQTAGLSSLGSTQVSTSDIHITFFPRPTYTIAFPNLHTAFTLKIATMFAETNK